MVANIIEVASTTYFFGVIISLTAQDKGSGEGSLVKVYKNKKKDKSITAIRGTN